MNEARGCRLGDGKPQGGHHETYGMDMFLEPQTVGGSSPLGEKIRELRKTGAFHDSSGHALYPRSASGQVPGWPAVGIWVTDVCNIHNGTSSVEQS